MSYTKNTNKPNNDYSLNIITDLVSTFKCSKCNSSIDTLELRAFTNVTCTTCGSIETVPARFCNFMLLDILCTNETRSIYRAIDESFDHPVVLKILPASFSDNPEFISEFRNEARTIAKLNHDNIAQVHSFGVLKRQPYIAMEVINGENLKNIIEESNGIPVSTAIRICYDISLGLEAAAKAGIVHENINPSNIILNKFGMPKLTSFGLITLQHKVDQEKIYGTPHYISPEQIRKQQVDERSNIYSLGATLYHMLVGEPPFAGKNNLDIMICHLEQPPDEVKILRPEIPRIVSNIVKRMLNPDPAKRYSSYKSLLDDLGKAISIHSDKEKTTPERGARKQIKFKKTIKATPIIRKTNEKKQDHVDPRPKPIKVKQKPRVHTQRKQKVNIKKPASIKFHKLNKKKPSPVSLKDQSANKILKDQEKLRKQHLRQQKKKKKQKRVIIIISAILISIAAIFTLYIIHEKKMARIELYALKNAKDKSNDIYALIQNNISTVTNSFITSSAIKTNVNQALQLLSCPTLDTFNSSTTNAVITNTATNSIRPQDPNDALNINDVSTEVAQQSADLSDKMTFDFKDERIPEVTAKALLVHTNITQLEYINNKTLLLKQSAELGYLKARNSKLSKTVKSQNIKLKSLANKSVELSGAATETINNIKVIHDEIIVISKEHVTEVERRHQAALEIERQRLEAIRLEEKRIAYAALVKRELNQVKLDHVAVGTNSYMFVEINFKGIVKQLENNFLNYKTDEGQKSAKVVIDKFKAMVSLKGEIIKCINKHTFPWGWGEDRAACDIIRADDNGIYVKNKSYPWGSANIPQMLKFIDYYLTLQKVNYRSKSKLSLGGAVYCAEFGEKAKAKSEEFRNKAILFGVKESKLDRLLDEY